MDESGELQLSSLGGKKRVKCEVDVQSWSCTYVIQILLIGPGL